MHRLNFITCFTAFLLQNAAIAQIELNLALEPSSGVISDADVAVLKVGIGSSKRIDTPAIEVEGGELRVEHAGVSEQLSFGIGTRTRRQVLHQYALRGKPGRYTLRAKATDADGLAYESDPVVLTIRKRTPQEVALDPEMLIRLPKTSVYAGEPLVAEVIIAEKPGSQFRAERNNAPTLEGDGFKSEFSGDPYRAEPYEGNSTVGYQLRLTPLKPGDLNLSASLEAQFSVRLSNRGIPRLRRFSLKTPPTTLQVKPLPREGRPSDFSGAIGSFDLKLVADPVALNAGEPIALRMTVSGRGNFDLLQTPQTSSKDGWKFYKPTRMDLQRGQRGQPDRLVFAQNIVPQSAKTEIPQFRLTAFDPASEQYVTLLTDPIPITVSGATAATAPAPAAALTNGGDEDRGGASASQPETRMTDILSATSVTSPNWAKPTAASWRSPGFWWLNGGLALALIGLAVVARFFMGRKTPTTTAGFRQRLDTLCKSTTNNAGEFYTAVQKCIDAARGEFPKDMEDEEPLKELLNEQDRVLYSGDPSAANRSIDQSERQRVIDQLKALPAQG